MRLFRTVLQDLKLKHRILLSYAFFVLIPLVLVSVAISVGLSDILVRTQLDAGRAALGQSAASIEGRLESMESTLNILAFDPNLNRIFARLGSSAPYPLGEQTVDFTDMTASLYALQRVSGPYALRIYLPDAFYYSAQGVSYNRIADLADKDWYLALTRGNGIFVHFEDRYVDYKLVSHDVLTVARLVRDPSSFTHTIAAIAAECPNDEVAAQLLDIDNGLLFLVAPSGETVSKEPDRASDWLSAAATLEPGSWNQLRNARGEAGYLLSREVGDTGWRVVCALESKGIFRLRNDRLVLLFLVLGLLTLTTLGFTLLVSASSARRLEKLTAMMRRVEAGDLDLPTGEYGRDEIGEISTRFTQAIGELRELLRTREELDRRVDQAEIAAVRARIQALQSQVNPHFLYNALDLILWKAMYNDIPKVEQLVQSLADFYKLTLSSGQDVVPISHEISHVKAYLTIQNTRFDDRFQLETDTGPVDDYLIPSITLQPLVENAILHGLMKKRHQKGTILVTGRWVEPGTIRLEVHDDGVGVAPDLVERLNAVKPGDGWGVGVANVRERIRLYFRGASRVVCASEPGHGTTFVLEFPAIRDMQYFERLDTHGA
jgi:two-component system, sensor histidine kinase YesM